MAVINGNNQNNLLSGIIDPNGDLADTLNGGAGNDTLNGLGTNDTLNGGSGNDSLNGGSGNDTMSGGTNNDTYGVGSAGDIVVENAGEGIDLVQSTISYTLTANTENLILLGTAINGRGNGLNNQIAGNAANNSLAGLAGNDTLSGQNGNDLLDGGTGNDTLAGGIGNDTFVVDAAGDTVNENAGQGTDLVQSSITYALAANLENLSLTGAAAINGGGNGLDNVMVGNASNNNLLGLGGNDRLSGQGGNDLLDGGTGNDTMIGGLGNDTFVVGNAGDVVNESAGQGTDLVQSSINYALGNNVENLLLTGTALSGTGNGLNNGISGNASNNTLFGSGGLDTLLGQGGNDVLDGGAGDDSLSGGNNNDLLAGGSGNDTLTGGANTDRFLYDTGAVFAAAAVGTDTITDFVAGTDRIVLDKTTFSRLNSVAGAGFSVANDFAVVVNNAAIASSTALIVYNSTTGALVYNENRNGAGLGTGGQFASLTGSPAIAAADFLIQA